MYGRPIPLLDFQPDASSQTPGILTDTDGFYSVVGGLRTLPSFVALVPPAQLPAPSLGAYTATLTSGFHVVVAGTAAHLYKLTSSGWVENDGGQTFNTVDRWRFATFGDDILAVNGVDPNQVSIAGAPFVPLSSVSYGNPPIAALVEVVDQGVFLVPPRSNTWYFSLSDRVWTGGIAAGVVSAPLTGTPGPITAIHRIRGGVAIYKEMSFYFGQFTTPPFFWDFTSISENVGVAAQEIVINAGDLHLWLGPDDFYLFDASSLQRIPNSLKEWFFRRLDPLFAANILGHWDRTNSLAIWNYATTDTEPAGARNEWLTYAVRTGRWTKGTASALGVDAVQDVLQPGFVVTTDLTYIGFGERYPTYDVVPNLPYNSDTFGEDVTEVQAVFDSNGNLLIGTGAPLAAYVTTWEIGDGSFFWQLSRVRPIFLMWPLNNFGHLQSYYRRNFGYPLVDPNPFPQKSLGPQATLTKDGAYNLIVTGRSLMLKLDFNAEVEIMSVALDLIQVGTE